MGHGAPLLNINCTLELAGSAGAGGCVSGPSHTCPCTAPQGSRNYAMCFEFAYNIDFESESSLCAVTRVCRCASPALLPAARSRARDRGDARDRPEHTEQTTRLCRMPLGPRCGCGRVCVWSPMVQHKAQYNIHTTCYFDIANYGITGTRLRLNRVQYKLSPTAEPTRGRLLSRGSVRYRALTHAPWSSAFATSPIQAWCGG